MMCAVLFIIIIKKKMIKKKLLGKPLFSFVCVFFLENYLFIYFPMEDLVLASLDSVRNLLCIFLGEIIYISFFFCIGGF